jgi:hypothetical protein
MAPDRRIERRRAGRRRVLGDPPGPAGVGPLFRQRVLQEGTRVVVFADRAFGDQKPPTVSCSSNHAHLLTGAGPSGVDPQGAMPRRRSFVARRRTTRPDSVKSHVGDRWRARPLLADARPRWPEAETIVRRAAPSWPLHREERVLGERARSSFSGIIGHTT